MRIGHYQCICRPEDFTANLATVTGALARAAELGITILCFPETFLAGYFSDADRCRANAWTIDSPQMTRLLAETADFPVMFIVGFNELRGEKLYNTAAVVDQGRLVGTYCKAFPCFAHFTPGREAPVFHKDGCCFGVIICADGGYPEPARLLAMQGARVIFAPHYNYIGPENVIDHYLHVRHDHIARAVENGVFFVRGNNVERGFQESLGYEGIGYGDSYILDPNGQVMAAAGVRDEVLIWADIDLERRYYGSHNKSERSARAFWGQMQELLEETKVTDPGCQE